MRKITEFLEKSRDLGRRFWLSFDFMFLFGPWCPKIFVITP